MMHGTVGCGTHVRLGYDTGVRAGPAVSTSTGLRGVYTRKVPVANVHGYTWKIHLNNVVYHGC